MEKEPFVLAELEDLSAVFAPLKSTTRIKYTCFNVSANLLVLGASSGGLYVFRREPCVFLQLIPSKDGAVAQIAISPDERLMGVATVRGTVNLVERNQRGAKTVATSMEHQGSQITSLVWAGCELYVGDVVGRISVLARTVFQPPGFLLMQLDSRIVQLDASGGLLLVSTITRSYICDTEREHYRQIGHKLRDGVFGGCFLSNSTSSSAQEQPTTERERGAFSDGDKQGFDYSHLSHLRAFCSRPGARIWEVDAEGTVLKTHHFRDALATPPRPITTDQPVDNNNRFEVTPKRPDPVNFGRLFVVLTRYLLTFQEDAIYIFDPTRSSIVLWNDQIREITDVRVTGNVIYIWCASGKMHALNLVPLEKFLIRMYFWKKYLMVAELCLEFNEYLMEQASQSSKLHILKDLDKKLEECEDASPTLCASLAPLTDALTEQAHNNQVIRAQKLKSGIYQITRPTCLNLKNRSHSVSPDRLDKESLGSTSSLPELVQEVDESREQEAVELDCKDVSQVTEICQEIINSQATRDLTFQLIDKLVNLVGGSFSSVHPVPFSSLFSSDEISIITNTFRCALSSRLLLEYIQQAPDLDFSESHPSYLIDCTSESFLQLDLKLSKILKVFYWLLDENLIVGHIKSLAPQCYYLSLMEIISRFETNSMSINENMSNARNLSIALFLLRVGQVEQIARYKFDANDVMYLSLKLEEQLGQSGKSEQIAKAQSRVAFLSYLERLGKIRATCAEAYAINCLEAVEDTKKCECGFPIPGLRRSSVRFPKLSQQLLESVASNPAESVRVCSRLPSLWPQLLRMRIDDDFYTLLPLVLHLGEIDELERRLSDFDALLCEVSIRHLAGLHRGDCLNCARKLPSNSKVTISWTQFGLLLIKAIGPSASLDLLRKYAADVKDLEPTFHQALVLATVMEKHSQGLSAGVVDVMAGKSKHAAALLSPQLQADILPSGQQQQGPSHWGVKFASRPICPACSLSLKARVLTEGGVIVFKCRHAFHAVCLRDREECPACDNS